MYDYGEPIGTGNSVKARWFAYYELLIGRSFCISKQ